MKPYTIEQAETDLRDAIDDGDQERIERLGRTVDDLDTPRPAPSLLGAALWYAEVAGLKVFPLQPRDAVRVDRRTGEIETAAKTPYPRTRGCNDATTDPDQIRAWWEKWPRANVGIATGHLVDVIDIDGPAGVRTYLDMLDDLPPIFGKVSTPRPGGSHLYVAAVPGRGNKAKLLPGIDYRGTGGYVVAPPSEVSTGDTPGAYVWRAPLDLAALREAVAA